jgi:hypothetical protein
MRELFWKEENARRWIELGERDAATVVGGKNWFTTETQRH